jgi:hypothetical protein
MVSVSQQIAALTVFEAQVGGARRATLLHLALPWHAHAMSTSSAVFDTDSCDSDA